MHFKSALVVCAVYFLTSAWSAGLNMDQLIELNKLFKNYKQFTNESEILQFVENTIGMELINLEIVFKYNADEPDPKNFNYLLKALADKDKSSDKTEVETLKSFEVNFLLNKFMALSEFYKEPGYLTLSQLLEVFGSWKEKNSALNAKLKELKSDRDVGCAIHAVEFLLIILEIKTAVFANNNGLVSFGEYASGEDELNTIPTSMKESKETEHYSEKMNFADFMEKIFYDEDVSINMHDSKS